MGRDARANPQAFETTQIVPNEVYDCLGRTLHVGDQLVLTQPSVIVWEVSKIRPILDPRVPPNMVEIHIRSAANFLHKAWHPAGELLRIKSAEAVDTPSFRPPTLMTRRLTWLERLQSWATGWSRTPTTTPIAPLSGLGKTDKTTSLTAMATTPHEAGPTSIS